MKKISVTTAKLLWELRPIEEKELDLESRNEKPWLSLLQCGRKKIKKKKTIVSFGSH